MTIMPRGYRWTLVLASVTKWALKGEMPPKMRLDFLEHLEKLQDRVLTADVLALVEPMDKRGWEIVAEAQKLGPHRALDVYADKFDVFAQLNPSLLRAADKMAHPRVVDCEAAR